MKDSSTKKPRWLKKKINISEMADMKKRLARGELHTICEEAKCPNISECFCRGQASFLILGDICTRKCKFCNVNKGTPLAADESEPEKVAQTIHNLGLKYVVITSPTRDDLPDGGAEMYAKSIKEIKRYSPGIKVEVLIPDFNGDKESIKTVGEAEPEVISHNLETVPRLYDIRKGADYQRSLEVLSLSRELFPNIPTKSGIMAGLGETEQEVYDVFRDLLDAGCRLLSIGQYLAPSNEHYPVKEYVSPEKFEKYKQKGLEMGFDHIESAPYVRSSYRAENYINQKGEKS